MDERLAGNRESSYAVVDAIDPNMDVKCALVPQSGIGMQSPGCQPQHHSDQRILHVGQPNLCDRRRFQTLLDGVFDRRWLTNNGCLVQELERQLSDSLRVKHCVAVCNATTGLQLACVALGLSGEIIMPAFTFIATAHAARWVGLKPVFADVDRQSHLIDPDSVIDRITDRTSAILGVHLWGQPCQTDKLQQIATDHGLAFFTDAAHAFGCEHQGRMIGGFGDCEVFSFHATKFFNTFEGGAVTTNDDELANRLRQMRNFGFDERGEISGLGINAKMNEVCAAMGLAMLPSVEDLANHNRLIYERYRHELSGIDGLRMVEIDASSRTNHQYVVVEIDARLFGASRDRVLDFLHQHDVLARKYFSPGCHRAEPYRSEIRNSIQRLPRTDLLCQRVICLPTGSGIDTNDVDRVCHWIEQAAAWNRKPTRRAVG